MNTRLLMILSAAFMAALGVGISFLPQELLVHVGARPEGALVLLMQMLGALYMGFAILNWTARGNLTGGIYSRPVTLANFFNFAIGAVAFLKALSVQHFAFEVAAMATVYSVFGIWFGVVLFTNPAKVARA
ncbi:MAG: hypothetical protein ACREOO_02175 [bacterium]